jgi:hypothetical protein
MPYILEDRKYIARALPDTSTEIALAYNLKFEQTCELHIFLNINGDKITFMKVDAHPKLLFKAR